MNILISKDYRYKIKPLGCYACISKPDSNIKSSSIYFLLKSHDSYYTLSKQLSIEKSKYTNESKIYEIKINLENFEKEIEEKEENHTVYFFECMADNLIIKEIKKDLIKYNIFDIAYEKDEVKCLYEKADKLREIKKENFFEILKNEL